jgi:uncharacterized protein YcaQ
VRAHYLPLFSRLGAYPRGLLDRAAWSRKRELFEYWAHEASLLPLALHPWLRWRMARAERFEGTWVSLRRFARERQDHIAAILAEVERRGPIAASDLEGPKGAGGWWGWSDAKRALEWLFWAGRVTASVRRGGFERLYDLPERVLPADILALPTPAPEEAHRKLLELAAQALGVATESDLRDYFRLDAADVKPRMAELVESGEIVPVAVEGWRQQAYAHASAWRARRIKGQALLAPFDPLIFERQRTERLFGFRYRLEIYTPAQKRQHGYYVLPFLFGERLAARVDLKSDRQSGALRVAAVWPEQDLVPEAGDGLAAELKAMAEWLGLDRVVVAQSNAFARRLADAIGTGNQGGVAEVSRLSPNSALG